MIKVALVHDYLTKLGGAERVLKTFTEMFPDAPIYTLLFNKGMGDFLNVKSNIKVSFLRFFPKFLQDNARYLLPFLTVAPETFDLSAFPLVISSCNAFCKGVVTRSQTIHICYCHAPTRFLWDWYYEYAKENKINLCKKFFLLPLLNYLRVWDRLAAERVDFFIANSRYTQKRIRKYYHRSSEVIYPPVDVKRFEISKKNRGYFLIVSRLSPYKRIDLAVEAFNKLELPLVIVGEGTQSRYLRKIAKKNIRFTGFQNDQEVKKYLENCRAFIFCGEEDFGIAPVEAMACGKPVLALRKGGVLETVIEGKTGEFFDEPMEELLADGVRRLIENEREYNPYLIRQQAEKFSKENFVRNFKNFVEKIMQSNNK